MKKKRATDLKRYDRFGWDYESVSPANQDEVEWCIGHARQTGGPVLELASGTGRLLERLSMEGFECHGIELSETMIDISLKRAWSHKDEIRDRIVLYKADISNFKLSKSFGLICMVDNSFRELVTLEAMSSCLLCCRAHLEEGGRLIVSERAFAPGMYKDGVFVTEWSEPVPEPFTSHLVSRKVESRLSGDGRSVAGAFLYRTVDPDGRESTESCSFEAPILSVDDYLCLFEEAGFAASAVRGFGIEDDPASEWLTFVCHPA